jgi:hypothetical protein
VPAAWLAVGDKLSLSADIYLSVLNNSYDRMVVYLSTFSGDGRLMTGSPAARHGTPGTAELEPIFYEYGAYGRGRARH